MLATILGVGGLLLVVMIILCIGGLAVLKILEDIDRGRERE